MDTSDGLNLRIWRRGARGKGEGEKENSGKQIKIRSEKTRGRWYYTLPAGFWGGEIAFRRRVGPLAVASLTGCMWSRTCSARSLMFPPAERATIL